MGRTNVEINDELIDEAGRLTHIKTKKELIDLALRELVRKYKRRKLLSIRKPGLWEGNLDEMRKMRP